WATGPRVVFLHHVHADMWNMVLPPHLAKVGNYMEHTVAPWLYRRSRMITLSRSSKDEMLELGFKDELVEVVPPGIDPRYEPGGRLAETPTIVAVGRLAPVKRFGRLVPALVAPRGPRPAPELYQR